MNLVELLLERTDRTPDREALIDGRCGRERITSFAGMADRVAGCAERLRSAGLGEGVRVLVLVPMRAELYVTLAALWQIGACAVFLDPRAGGRHVAACCARTPPDGVVAMPRALPLLWLNRTLARIPRRLVWGRQLDFAATSTDRRVTAVQDDAPAILTFTSGSTGAPKGAIRSHRLLRAQFAALEPVLGLGDGATDLATMPVFALTNLAAGDTTLIPDTDLARPGFARLDRVCDQIRRFRPARCIASPAFLQRFPERTGQLGRVFTGGAPVFPGTADRIRRAFPDAELTVVYGSSEAEPVSHVSATEAGPAERARTADGLGLPVGRPVADAEVRVITDDWGRPIPPQTESTWNGRTLPPMETGEIVVAGDHVIPGYVDGAGDADNKVRVDDRIWHRTGDAGYFDREGRLWLMGRCAARMEIEGQPVYPFAIECAAVERFDIPIAACCEHRGTPTLFLPKEYKGSVPESFKAGGVTIPRVLRRRIPLDRRHNAKVDYGRLQR